MEWKRNWPLLACTLAIIATLIGCTYWLEQQIDYRAVELEMQIKYPGR